MTTPQNGILKTAGAITRAEALALRKRLFAKWGPELMWLIGPDGTKVHPRNLVIRRGKKRVILRVHVDPAREFVQEDWANCEYLHYKINLWFEAIGSCWRFRIQEVRK